MSDDNNSARNGGIGFCGLLTIVLIVLKLTNLTDISWWWVFAPILIPLAVCLFILPIIFIVAIIAESV